MGRTSIDGNFYAKLGQNVAAAREKSGLTQEELAFKLGVTRASISNVELGKQRVLAHQLSEFAHFLDVPYEQLIPQFDERKNNKSAIREQIEKKLSEVADDKSVESMLRKISGSAVK